MQSPHLTHEQLRDLFVSVDEDKSGLLDIEEFIAMIDSTSRCLGGYPTPAVAYHHLTRGGVATTGKRAAPANLYRK